MCLIDFFLEELFFDFIRLCDYFIDVYVLLVVVGMFMYVVNIVWMMIMFWELNLECVELVVVV